MRERRKKKKEKNKKKRKRKESEKEREKERPKPSSPTPLSADSRRSPKLQLSQGVFIARTLDYAGLVPAHPSVRTNRRPGACTVRNLAFNIFPHGDSDFPISQVILFVIRQQYLGFRARGGRGGTPQKGNTTSKKTTARNK